MQNYIDEHLNIDEASIQIERANHIRGKNSPQPIIVKLSHYKDRENFLKAYCKQEGQVALKRSPEFCLKLTYRYL